MEKTNITYVPIKKTGEILRAAPMDRAGIFFLEYLSRNAMETLTADLFKFAKIETLNNE